MVKTIVRLEGLAIFLFSIFMYFAFGMYTGRDPGWGFFLLMLFMPDVSMVGYLFKRKKLGAILYNSMHNLILPLFLLTLAIVPNVNSELLFKLAIILFAHVGLDRMLGFGLKYPTGFKHTHIQKL